MMKLDGLIPKLVLVSLSLLPLLATCFDEPGSSVDVDTATDSKNADDDDILERFFESETDRLVGPDSGLSCSIEGAGLDAQLDDLAYSLSSVAGRGNRALQYQDSLANAINLGELGQPKKAHKSELFSSKGILDALEEPKPTVVHSRSFSAQAERDLIQYLWYTKKKLSQSEKEIVLCMFSEANLSPNQRQIVEEGLHERILNGLGGDRLKKLVLSEVPAVSEVAVALADQLYLSPSFLEHLPVVGVGIKALKQIGKFPYEIIGNIRSVKQHVELFLRAPGEDFESKVKAAAGSRQGRLMLSAVGLKSLNWLAIKLIDRFSHITFGKKDIDEIVQRCAYYILMHFAMKLTDCMFHN